MDSCYPCVLCKIDFILMNILLLMKCDKTGQKVSEITKRNGKYLWLTLIAFILVCNMTCISYYKSKCKRWWQGDWLIALSPNLKQTCKFKHLTPFGSVPYNPPRTPCLAKLLSLEVSSSKPTQAMLFLR